METDPQESSFALAVLIVPCCCDTSCTLAWHMDLPPGLMLSVSKMSSSSTFIRDSDRYMPLATDEIKKLHGCRYYLQVDGFSAYWSIPVCEESKRLTAFHTPLLE